MMILFNVLGIGTEEKAKNARQLSALMSLGMAFYIGYLVHMTRVHSMPLPFHRGSESLLDVVLFLALAGGLLINLTLAAWLVLFCFVLDQWVLFHAGGLMYQSLMIVIGCIFARAVLAVHSSHFLVKRTVVYEENIEEAKSASSPPRFWYLIALVVLVLGGLIWSIGTDISPNKPDTTSYEENALQNELNADDFDIFELVTGEMLRGKILREDDVYYQVEVAGAQRIVIKEDIKSLRRANAEIQ